MGDKLEKQLEKQREAQAEIGRAQSARTGQSYQEIDAVPLSDEAVAQAEAVEDASKTSNAGLDTHSDSK